ncbi:MAG: DUF4430 domain-containing protein [Patescibacteria group bacterium]
MWRNTLIAAGIGALLLVGVVVTTETPTPDTTAVPTEEHAPKEISSPTPAQLDTYAFVADATGTVELLMLQKRDEGLLTYVSRTYPTLGSFVESIQGHKNEGGSYWMLYINDSFSSVGMSQATVIPGDRIEWRYE